MGPWSFGAASTASFNYNPLNAALQHQSGATIFRPTGTYGTEHPTGTGPFMFEEWTQGDRLVYTLGPVPGGLTGSAITGAGLGAAVVGGAANLAFTGVNSGAALTLAGPFSGATGTAILLLKDEGKLSLDDPAHELTAALPVDRRHRALHRLGLVRVGRDLAPGEVAADGAG